MSSTTQTLLQGLVKLALYVIAWEPAPDTDATLISLRAKLSAAETELAASVAANQPK